MASFKERYEEWEKKKGASGESSDSSQSASFKDRYKAWYGQQIDVEGVAKSIADRTSTWVQNHNNYLANYNERYSSRKGTYEDAYVSDAGDWLTTVSGQKENFDKEASNILAMLDRYGDYLDKDWAESVRNTLTSASTQQADILKYATGDSDYWAQFASPDEYGAWQRTEGYKSKYSGKTYEDLQAELDALEDGEERQWLSQYQLGTSSKETYEALGAEDLEQYSGYTDTKQKGLLKSEYADTTYEIVNRNSDAWNQVTIGKVYGKYSDRQVEDLRSYEYMTDDEIKVYNYRYAKGGWREGQAYLDSIKGILEARKNHETMVETQKFAEEHPWAASGVSVMTSLGSGFEYLDELVYNGLDKKAGKEVNLDTNISAAQTNIIRGSVSEQVAWEIGNWDAGAFLYNTAMSGADSLVSGLAFGKWGGAVLGLSAAAQATNDALDRGMNDGQAFLNGLVAGTFEGLFETVSIGNLNKLKEVAPESVKDIIKNLGKSMLVNASEETLTELANITYDTMINGEFANYTWEELKNGAWKEALAQVIEAGASGALMGVGMGTVGNTMGYAKASSEAKNIYGSDPGALVGEALEIDPSNTFAQKMQGKLDSGKKLSGGQLNKLVQQNERAMTAQDMASIQSAAEQRLADLGEIGDVSTIAQALAKQAAGEKLSQTEKQAISGSQYGSRVANELNTENIKSGGYSSEWAQKIGTNRINAQEYGRMLKASQTAQEGAETTEGQVVTQAQNEAQQGQVASAGGDVAVSKTETTTQKVSEDGVTRQVSTGNAVTPQKIVSIKNGKAMIQTDSGTIAADDIEFGDGDTDLLWRSAASFNGITTAGANGIIHAYRSGQPVATYLHGAGQEFQNGYYNLPSGGEAADKLTPAQRAIIYELGQQAARENAAKKKGALGKTANNGNPKHKTADRNTGRRKKGTVKGYGITTEKLNKAFNTTQTQAYQILSTIAEVTGIDIVLYRSTTDVNGNLRSGTVDGMDLSDAQGAFSWHNDKIYIDINAGVLKQADMSDVAKYSMLRTFSHEFTHFLEKYAPGEYEAFRELVFDTMQKNGTDPQALIDAYMDKHKEISQEEASREVVAEAMTDILPETNFVQELAEKHKNIFEALREKLKLFIDKIKAYFKSIGYNRSAEAAAVKKEINGVLRYTEDIVKLFDQIAVQAVERYQEAGAKPEQNHSNNMGDSVAHHQDRTSTLTNRDIIAELTGKNDLQREKIREYQQTLEQSREQSQIMAEKKSAIEELTAANDPANKQKILDLRLEMSQAKNRRDIYEAKLRRMEDGVLAPVIEREKGRILERLRSEYGTIRKGENAVRDDSLPVSTDGKNKVSQTARTVKGAGATTDEFADLIDTEVTKGGLSYIPITNSETTQKAVEFIRKEGWTAAKANWSASVRAGKVSAELSAIGAILLNNAANTGNRTEWLDILHDYQYMGTNAGQATQALRILKQLQPEDKLYMVKRSLTAMVEDMHLDTEITLDEALEQQYLDAPTAEGQDAVLKQITKNVADQIPSTVSDWWNALRYVNMLGNLRTQVRNITGNLGMQAVTSFKNTVAAGLEQIAYVASGGKFQRTKSMTVSRDLLKAAKNDFYTVEEIILGGGKYSDTKADATAFARAVQDQRTIFKIKNTEIKPLEGYRKITNWAMEQGDLVFSKGAYARALAGYLKAQGITGTDLSKVDTALVDEARLYAVKEAQEATFRDTNVLSGWISKVGRRKDTPKAARMISEGIMPFRKTPANVLVRAEEYSPLGVINSVYTSIQAMQKNTDVTGAQVVNSWAKTLTGTGLFALGMLLQNLGLLVGGPDDDENQDDFDSLNGWQNYAIVLPDGTNLTIDFLSPAAIPMFMGAQLNKLMQDGNIEVKEIERAMTSLADPMIQMSMLQGVNDTLENIQYAEDNLGQFLINAAVSYLTQGMTNTLLGQLERSFEQQRMSTYVDKDNNLPNWLQRTLGKASAKTPGWDYNQIPYINAWGEEEEYSGTVSNLLYNLLSPSYIDKGEDDAVSSELTRLNGVQSDVNVFPQTPSKSLSFTDKDGTEHENYNLSAEEYVELAKAQGQTQRKLVEDLIGSQYYSALSDANKAKAIQYAYKYAKEYAQIEVLNRDGFSAKWMAEIDGDAAEMILRKVAAGTTEKYMGLSISSAAYVADLLDGIALEEGYTNVRDIQRIETVSQDSNLSESEKEAVLRDIMGNSLGSKFDSAVEMGVDMDSFVKSYRMYLDTSGEGKKQMVINYCVKTLGLPKTKAEELYKLFSGAK